MAGMKVAQPLSGAAKGFGAREDGAEGVGRNTGALRQREAFPGSGKRVGAAWPPVGLGLDALLAPLCQPKRQRSKVRLIFGFGYCLVFLGNARPAFGGPVLLPRSIWLVDVCPFSQASSRKRLARRPLVPSLQGWSWHAAADSANADAAEGPPWHSGRAPCLLTRWGIYLGRVLDGCQTKTIAAF